MSRSRCYALRQKLTHIEALTPRHLPTNAIYRKLHNTHLSVLYGAHRNHIFKLQLKHCRVSLIALNNDLLSCLIGIKNEYYMH